MHGMHLNGVSFLVARIASVSRCQNPCKVFLITALTWFDLLRAFSGAEKLAFPPETRTFVSEASDASLITLIGCPPEIFTTIGEILQAAKVFRAGDLAIENFQAILDQTHDELQAWDPKSSHYPDDDIEWSILANAYRHTAVLRNLRFPDTWAIPCTDKRIQSSVIAILDSAAEIPRQSHYFKRLLFPLFVAGAETSSPHQEHYINLCIDHIRDMTGFPHPSLSELLEKTWEGRKASDGTRNVPWFEYVEFFLEVIV